MFAECSIAHAYRHVGGLSVTMLEGTRYGLTSDKAND